MRPGAALTEAVGHSGSEVGARLSSSVLAYSTELHFAFH